MITEPTYRLRVMFAPGIAMNCASDSLAEIIRTAREWRRLPGLQSIRLTRRGALLLKH